MSSLSRLSLCITHHCTSYAASCHSGILKQKIKLPWVLANDFLPVQFSVLSKEKNFFEVQHFILLMQYISERDKNHAWDRFLTARYLMNDPIQESRYVCKSKCTSCYYVCVFNAQSSVCLIAWKNIIVQGGTGSYIAQDKLIFLQGRKNKLYSICHLIKITVPLHRTRYTYLITELVQEKKGWLEADFHLHCKSFFKHSNT